jgi:hypothetical protein
MCPDPVVSSSENGACLRSCRINGVPAGCCDADRAKPATLFYCTGVMWVSSQTHVAAGVGPERAHMRSVAGRISVWQHRICNGCCMGGVRNDSSCRPRLLFKSGTHSLEAQWSEQMTREPEPYCCYVARCWLTSASAVSQASASTVLSCFTDDWCQANPWRKRRRNPGSGN